jgi:probable HAF family extracellular repeat protein
MGRGIMGLAWCFLLTVPLTAGGATLKFTGLGFLDPSLSPGGPRSEAYGISADGSAIAGFNKTTGGFRAYRWTAASGMVSLGALDSIDPYSDGLAISADGTTVVGESRLGDGMVAHRWTAAAGMQPVGFPLGGSASSAAAVSGDGAYVAGYVDSASPNRSGFRWSAATGVQFLGNLPGGVNTSSQPNGITPDGSTIVGVVSNGPNRAFIWDVAHGIRLLNDVTPNPFFFGSSAWAITPDGKWVVGSGDQAFRWNADTGYQLLGSLMGRAMAVSADGNIIVGDGLNNTTAFIWDPVNGARELKPYLVDELGLNLDGWTLKFASAISADGTVIAGTGIDASGQTEAWVVVVPEPGGLTLTSLVVFSACARRRRSSDS